ncbi:hypothetical protein BH11PSE12_BH11PSE12_26290 [soil metagenome]
MLRFFFWTLLLVNGLLLALNLGFLGNWSFDLHEPQRMKDQQHADQLHLISASAALASGAAASEAAKNEAKAAASEIIACLEVGNFAPADGPKFEEKLKQLGLGDRQSRHNVTDVASHMVFIPSMGSKEGADKKTAELRRLGVTDFFVVQDQSNLRWGISLGVFKTEEAAKAHLANLNNKGVKSARIGPRAVSAAKFSYQLHALSADEKKAFDAIKAEYPNQETRSCQTAAYQRH